MSFMKCFLEQNRLQGSRRMVSTKNNIQNSDDGDNGDDNDDDGDGDDAVMVISRW